MPHLMEGLDIRLYHRYGLDIFCLVPTSRGAYLVFAMTTLGCKYWYVCSFCQLRTPSSKFLLRYFEFVSISLCNLPEDLIDYYNQFYAVLGFRFRRNCAGKVVI